MSSAWPPADPATVLPGDCRATLATLPPGVFQTCVTSIPYFGLRSYSTEPQVWGGDPACAHEWGGIIAGETKQAQRYFNGQGFVGERGGAPSARRTDFDKMHGAFCTRCTAWRGEYGSEPTLAAYIAHTVEVFRAVRRVLRPDGTLFLNVGDAYSNAGYSNQTNTNGRKRGAGGKPKHSPKQTGARYRLRPDLTDQEIAYVLQELAACRQVRKPGFPNIPPGIHETVASATGSE